LGKDVNLRTFVSGWTSLACAIGLSIGGCLLLPAGALAQVIFMVNTTDDGADIDPGDGNCSTVAAPAPPICTLRAAVMQANRMPVVGALIKVPAGTYQLTIPAPIAGGEENGDLDILTPSGYSPGPTTIAGAGAGVTIIDGRGVYRILHVGVNRVATVSGVSMVNGAAPGADGGGILNEGTLTLNDSAINNSNSDAALNPGVGGGIRSYGTLTLNRVTLENNRAKFGGGIYKEGSLTVIDSTIAGNHSIANGGGLYNAQGSASIDRSTIAGNSAAYGGGIENDATLQVINSTISENHAAEDGGGIYNVAMTNIYNSTIAFNESDSNADSHGLGPGIYNYGSQTFNLRNSVVAGNHYPGPYGLTLYNDCHGALTSYGYNRFYSLTDCSVVQSGAGSVTQLVPSAALGALQDNGGPTRTIALKPVANANLIDYATTCTDQNGFVLATDQRGRPRIVGASCDVGAFEYDPGDIFANGFQ
jgi:CSLREA domain-containing protein